jgi:tetratricopeptide (TPR) repeat protein
LLKYRRFARAIALVEGLAQRIPQDPEVRQWQAIAYQSWGRHLVNERQLDKARIYLKKALRTDPHNRSLWAEVERDFRRIEQINTIVLIEIASNRRSHHCSIPTVSQSLRLTPKSAIANSLPSFIKTLQ